MKQVYGWKHFWETHTKLLVLELSIYSPSLEIPQNYNAKKKGREDLEENT